MKRVLFVGDINVDVILSGLESQPIVDREITCESFDVVMGSCAVICACTYASLGGRSSFIGLAGNDEYGDFMLKGMDGFGVDTSLVRRTSEVRTGVTVNLAYESTRTQVTYPGTIAAFDGAGIEPTVFDGVTHVHFAGPYLQTGLRPEISRLLRAARDHGVTASLDPQWDASERWEHMAEWLPNLTYLFVNESEAVSITGAATPEKALPLLTAQTPCPVIKLGRRGALVSVAGSPTRVPTCAANVLDTAGAGDAFDAGFLFGVIEKELAPEGAARVATATGTRSCEFRGGLEARSSFADIVKFMEREDERV